MRTRQRQVVNGLVYGIGAFVVGWAITYVLAPSNIFSAPDWKFALWLFLNANFVSISGFEAYGFSAAFSNVDVLRQFPSLRSLRVVPILLGALGTVLLNITMGYTTRARHLILNGVAFVAGYVVAGLLALIVSGGRPGVSLIVVLAVVLALGTYVGSEATRRLTGGLPFFGVVSLGTVVAVGLAVILGGLVVLRAISPLIAVAVGGALTGAVLTWVARSLPT